MSAPYLGYIERDPDEDLFGENKPDPEWLDDAVPAAVAVADVVATAGEAGDRDAA